MNGHNIPVNKLNIEYSTIDNHYEILFNLECWGVLGNRY